MHISNVLIFLVVLSQGVVEGSVEDQVETSALRLASGDWSFERKEFKGVEPEAAVAFLREASACKNIDIATRLLSRALVLSESAAIDPNRRIMGKGLVDFAIEGHSPLLRQLAARNLRENYERYEDQIREHLDEMRIALSSGRRMEPGLLLLYGMAAEENVSELTNTLEGIKEAALGKGQIPGYYFDAVMARHGDSEAENRLVEWTEKENRLSYSVTKTMTYLLSYVPTETMKRYLTEGLRSNEILELAGGARVPRQDICANALVKMLSKKNGFPIKQEKNFGFDEAELNGIEEWCSDNLGIGRPLVPIEDLSGRPSIHPNTSK